MASMQISSPRPMGRIAKNFQEYNLTNRRLPRIDLKEMLKMKIDPTICKKTKTNGKMSIAKLPGFARFRREHPASCAFSGDTLRRLSGFQSLARPCKMPVCRAARARATPYNGITREGVENKGKSMCVMLDLCSLRAARACGEARNRVQSGRDRSEQGSAKVRMFCAPLRPFPKSMRLCLCLLGP
jgi:hypothetical protein